MNCFKTWRFAKPELFLSGSLLLASCILWLWHALLVISSILCRTVTKKKKTFAEKTFKKMICEALIRAFINEYLCINQGFYVIWKTNWLKNNGFLTQNKVIISKAQILFLISSRFFFTLFHCCLYINV